MPGEGHPAGGSRRPATGRPVPAPTPGGQPTGAARRRRSPDPLGKRALFWVPAGQEAPAGRPNASGNAPLGKRALYSEARPTPGVDDAAAPENPLADTGPISVECSSCAAVTRVGLIDFLLFQLPVGIWLPRGRFDRRMTCPACRHRVWASVTLRRK